MAEIVYLFAQGCWLWGPTGELPQPGLWVCREHLWGSQTGHYAVDHVAVVRWVVPAAADMGPSAILADWLAEHKPEQEDRAWVLCDWADLPRTLLREAPDGNLCRLDGLREAPARLIELHKPVYH